MSSNNSVPTLFLGGVAIGMVIGYLLGDDSEERTPQQELEKKTKQAIDEFMSKKQHRLAVLEFYQFLFDFIRSKSGIQNLDGNDLIQRVFEGDEPRLKFTRHAEYPNVKSDKGFCHLLRGVVLAFRNPASHARIEMTKREASVQIVLMAYLYRVIRDKTIRVSQDKK